MCGLWCRHQRVILVIVMIMVGYGSIHNATSLQRQARVGTSTRSVVFKAIFAIADRFEFDPSVVVLYTCMCSTIILSFQVVCVCVCVCVCGGMMIPPSFVFGLACGGL